MKIEKTEIEKTEIKKMQTEFKQTKKQKVKKSGEIQKKLKQIENDIFKNTKNIYLQFDNVNSEETKEKDANTKKIYLLQSMFSDETEEKGQSASVKNVFDVFCEIMELDKLDRKPFCDKHTYYNRNKKKPDSLHSTIDQWEKRKPNVSGTYIWCQLSVEMKAKQLRDIFKAKIEDICDYTKLHQQIKLEFINYSRSLLDRTDKKVGLQIGKLYTKMIKYDLSTFVDNIDAPKEELKEEPIIPQSSHQNNKFVTSNTNIDDYAFGEQYRYTPNFSHQSLYIESKYESLKKELVEYFKLMNREDDERKLYEKQREEIKSIDSDLQPLLIQTVDDLSNNLWIDDVDDQKLVGIFKNVFGYHVFYNSTENKKMQKELKDLKHALDENKKKQDEKKEEDLELKAVMETQDENIRLKQDHIAEIEAKFRQIDNQKIENVKQTDNILMDIFMFHSTNKTNLNHLYSNLCLIIETYRDEHFPIINCNAMQIIAVINSMYIIDNFDKLEWIKDEIIDYMKANEFDGLKLTMMTRKEFIKQFVNHFNDNKLAAQASKLYTAITKITKWDISKVLNEENNNDGGQTEEKGDSNETERNQVVSVGDISEAFFKIIELDQEHFRKKYIDVKKIDSLQSTADQWSMRATNILGTHIWNQLSAEKKTKQLRVAFEDIFKDKIENICDYTKLEQAVKLEFIDYSSKFLLEPAVSNLWIDNVDDQKDELLTIIHLEHINCVRIRNVMDKLFPGSSNEFYSNFTFVKLLDFYLEQIKINNKQQLMQYLEMKNKNNGLMQLLNPLKNNVVELVQIGKLLKKIQNEMKLKR